MVYKEVLLFFHLRQKVYKEVLLFFHLRQKVYGVIFSVHHQLESGEAVQLLFHLHRNDDDEILPSYHQNGAVHLGKELHGILLYPHPYIYQEDILQYPYLSINQYNRLVYSPYYPYFQHCI